MKIYLYDCESGVYQGEDFLDDRLPGGRQPLPPGATTIAPPAWRAGTAPVFKAGEHCWELRPVAGLRRGGDDGILGLETGGAAPAGDRRGTLSASRRVNSLELNPEVDRLLP